MINEALSQSDKFLAQAKKVYEDRVAIINGHNYGIKKVDFKTATQFAAFAEKMDGIGWLGSDEFHEKIKPQLLANITHNQEKNSSEGMTLAKQPGVIESDIFQRDALMLFSTAIIVFCYPLVAAAA